MIKIYICGRCKFKGTRKDLRKHMKEVHLIKREIANIQGAKKKIRRPEWKTEEFK